ncbi:uncharacterized protein LOC130999206 isoform X2 [Salvia miltiorrhiza]|uniref:uncharacterized protein LOC130999206 isoform X2 n=1 Tax=Salvia miltiorrhiza TaxID=226208 RepID=UPI0025AC2DB5|nr:uncharacterized protein LOC130999206 isoform X2 [Salvia miltiorrhiza]
MASEEAKLELFLQWLKINGAELRGCRIKYCNSSKGFGIFSSNDVPDGIFLVIPLDLAITPMKVLEDPLIGPACRSMFEEGEVDDRFLMMLFLTVERLRKNSTWKPYLDMLPTEFGSTLWFTDDDLLELKGTTLHRATELLKKSLKTLFDEKVKKLAEKLLVLAGNPESEVRFEDFLWANSIFWTRALNIPFPSSYVFRTGSSNAPGASTNSTEKLANGENAPEMNKSSQVSGSESTSRGDTIWVEGLVPGIDFCNHDLKAAATWEIDGSGSLTGTPFSMYLLSAGIIPFQGEKEISISYGAKGNEELLFLYGFVIKDNSDDYLMLHYPVEAISDMPFSEGKLLLLEEQKGELRCLLPRSLLNNGFFPESTSPRGTNSNNRGFDYTCSGHRKPPSYADKLVFPEKLLTALRTVTMTETQLHQVYSSLEKLVGSGVERRPSESEVRAAVWEACGNSGALQLIVDLLYMKMTELEEGSGTEAHDAELLKKADVVGAERDTRCSSNGSVPMSRNAWASVVYRRGQKELTRRFLREAEHALQLALREES